MIFIDNYESLIEMIKHDARAGVHYIIFTVTHPELKDAEKKIKYKVISYFYIECFCFMN